MCSRPSCPPAQSLDPTVFYVKYSLLILSLKYCSFCLIRPINCILIVLWQSSVPLSIVRPLSHIHTLEHRPKIHHSRNDFQHTSLLSTNNNNKLKNNHKTNNQPPMCPYYILLSRYLSNFKTNNHKLKLHTNTMILHKNKMRKKICICYEFSG